MKRAFKRPAIVREDLGIIAGKGFAYGDRGACTTEQNRCAYDAVRASYAAGKSVGSPLSECAPATLKKFCERPS